MAMSCDRISELAPGYVLGALDTDDMIEVRDHLSRCRQPHSEIAEMGGVVPYLAETIEPIEPPAWLRESVLSAARSDVDARRRAQELVSLPVSLPVAARATVTPLREEPAPLVLLSAARGSRRRRAMGWASRVAAAAAIVVLGGYAVVLQGDLQKAKNAQSEDASLYYMWAQPDTLRAVLVASDGSGASGMAALRPTGHILVRLHGLVRTKGEEVYAVWINSGGATPTKAGTLTVDDSGSGYLDVNNVPTTASLWVFVCREPNAGVTAPTGPIIVSGTISL
jgi:hypothetical protein